MPASSFKLVDVSTPQFLSSSRYFLSLIFIFQGGILIPLLPLSPALLTPTWVVNLGCEPFCSAAALEAPCCDQSLFLKRTAAHSSAQGGHGTELLQRGDTSSYPLTDKSQLCLKTVPQRQIVQYPHRAGGGYPGKPTLLERGF